MHILISALLCFILYTTATFADEFDTEAQKVLELSNTVEPALQLTQDLLVQASPNLVKQLEQRFTAQGKEFETADVEALVADYRARLIERLRQELVPLIVSEYRKFFSLEDIKDVRKLMEMPAFQKFASKIPAITKSSQQAGASFGQKLGIEVMQELISENPKFR